MEERFNLSATSILILRWEWNGLDWNICDIVCVDLPIFCHKHHHGNAMKRTNKRTSETRDLMQMLYTELCSANKRSMLIIPKSFTSRSKRIFDTSLVYEWKLQFEMLLPWNLNYSTHNVHTARQRTIHFNEFGSCVYSVNHELNV